MTKDHQAETYLKAKDTEYSITTNIHHHDQVLLTYTHPPMKHFLANPTELIRNQSNSTEKNSGNKNQSLERKENLRVPTRRTKRALELRRASINVIF